MIESILDALEDDNEFNKSRMSELKQARLELTRLNKCHDLLGRIGRLVSLDCLPWTIKRDIGLLTKSDEEAN